MSCLDPFPSVSQEYVLSDVETTADPTGSSVAMAFVTPGTLPSSSDFVTASWGGTWDSGTQLAQARCLIGPTTAAAATLAAGNYDVYVRVTATPQVPVIAAGQITVI